MGYMETYEWDGAEWVPRRPVRPIKEEENAKWPREAVGEAPLHWSGRESATDWRQIILDCLSKDIDEAECLNSKEFEVSYEGEKAAAPTSDPEAPGMPKGRPAAPREQRG